MLTMRLHSSDMSSPYSILGLEQGADAAEVRRAFRIIAKSCHPDVNPDKKAQHKFVKAQEAYHAITHGAASCDKPFFKKGPRGRTIEIDLPMSIWTGANGGMVKGECALGRASVKVPKGVRSGDKILTKIGSTLVACVVNILEEDGFRADGGDISTILRLSTTQARTGGFAEIDTPVGKLKIKIPLDTPDGARLRVSDKGMPGNEKRPAGHLYLDVEIVDTITDRAVRTLDAILEKAKRPRKKNILSGLPVFGKKQAG